MCVCVCAKYNNKKVSREKKQRRRKKSINTLCQIMYSCVGAYFHPRCVFPLCLSIQSGIRTAFMVKRQQHKHRHTKKKKIYYLDIFVIFSAFAPLLRVYIFVGLLLWLSIYLFSCYICVSMGVIWCVCVCACLFVWINVENLFFSYIFFFSFHIILPLYPFVHNLIFRLGYLYL